MADTLPKVNRLDLSDEELVIVTLLFQSTQAKLQMNLSDLIATAQMIVTLSDRHFELFKSIGAKIDKISTQEEYEQVLSTLMFDKCPDCGEYHA